MSSPAPIRPDPMPLREALRGLRHFLRRGGQTIRETVQIDALPGPAAGLADAVLREAAAIVESVDKVTSGVAQKVLGGHGPAPSLDQMTLAPEADAVFAAAVYVALRRVAARLGAAGVFVSEAAARAAYDAITSGPGGAVTASDLTLRLLEARVIRDAQAREAAQVPGAALEPVAVFAVMLWLQADRSEADGESALDAATDLTVAIAADVAAACAARDTARLAALYTEFAPHV